MYKYVLLLPIWRPTYDSQAKVICMSQDNIALCQMSGHIGVQFGSLAVYIIQNILTALSWMLFFCIKPHFYVVWWKMWFDCGGLWVYMYVLSCTIMCSNSKECVWIQNTMIEVKVWIWIVADKESMHVINECTCMLKQSVLKCVLKHALKRFKQKLFLMKNSSPTPNPAPI